MLKHHTPTCNHKPIKPCGAIDTSYVPPIPIYKHKTGDDEDDEEEDSPQTNTIAANSSTATSSTSAATMSMIANNGSHHIAADVAANLLETVEGGKHQLLNDNNNLKITTTNATASNLNENVNVHENNQEDNVVGGGGLSAAVDAETGNVLGSGLKIKLPDVACTICGAHFSDQELFTKHIQMHEMELYTDNPLASMFDTGPADPNQFYMDRMNENGEYSCDLCTKSFTQMTALKVHRKWHFRGDSKQVSLWTCAARQSFTARA